MNDIIESMAKAICCPNGRCCRADPDPRYSFQFPCEAYQHKAEATAVYAAALAHLEKPTPEMIEAIDNELLRQYGANPRWEDAKDVIENIDAEPLVTAMIRAAK